MEYESKNLDHLGIVSAMCNEIGLVEIIDKAVGVDSRHEMTIGECVKLMIINGLGFTSRPQYLEAQFYDSKPIELLLGREIKAEKITDDRLGRALDCCYKKGCSSIFSKVSTAAALHFNVDTKFRSLDSTSISVEGEYDEENGIGLIEFGYSKDHRPDLKQFMVSLCSSQDGDVPLLAKTIAGNTSDTKHFGEVLSNLKDQIYEGNSLCYYIADSALYSKENIKNISEDILWISRVPEKLNAVKDLIEHADDQTFKKINENYSYLEMCSNYGGVRQRWVLVRSEHAYIKENKTLNKKIEREHQKITKEIKTFTSQEFGCKRDLENSIKKIGKKFRFHTVNVEEVIEVKKKKGRGRPKVNEKLDIVYKFKATIEKNEDAITKEKNKLGKFIVGSNEISESNLTAVELIDHYKGQQCVERGFRFLKDPMFMASSVFLKKQERIVALGMIMCLCLLVYTLTQRKLRKSLEDKSETIKSQTGKPTSKPTMKWVFQVFEGVHVLYCKKENAIERLFLNLNPERIKILGVLGPPYQKMYENAA